MPGTKTAAVTSTSILEMDLAKLSGGGDTEDLQPGEQDVDHQEEEDKEHG